MCATTTANKQQQNGTTTTTSTTNNNTTKTSQQQLPPPKGLCTMWWKLYNTLPHMAVLGYDVSVTIATVCLLTCLRFLAEYCLVNVFNWPSDLQITKEAAGSTVSIFHSVNLVPALLMLFLYHGYEPSQALSRAPQWYRDCVSALLQFCTGYMIYDGILNIILLKWDIGLQPADYMFLGHHLATALYMTSTRVVQGGHMSAMMCMFLGEMTNPLHNGFYIGQFAQTLDCCNGPLSQQLYHWITMAFCIAYVPIRAIVAPIFCVHMTYDLWWNGRKNHIPLLLIAIWTFLIWAVIIGSKPWIDDCYVMLQKGYNGESISSEL